VQWSRTDTMKIRFARRAGEPVFDAYLVGMLHDTGWTVALCVLDRSALPFAMPLRSHSPGR
jgi:hypothetical protein